MIVTEEQIVSLHTINGVQLHQFLGGQQSTVTWNRELREVSRCELTIPTPTPMQLIDIMPWMHCIDVWDAYGEELYWTGPVQKVVYGREEVTISARDPAAFAARTRCPITKKWDGTDPAVIARELWEALIEAHGLHAKCVDRTNPLGERFDFDVKADAKMLDVILDDLVSQGLFWSVVSGVPILGPAPLKPIAALGEHDFIGPGLTLVRDGAATFNDVLLRGADNIAHARVDLGGLNLQTTVDIDNMFGVSNAMRAVNQHVRYTSTIRDAVVLADTAVLHPRAPLTIGQLIPSIRINVEAYGLLATTELESVEVTCTPADTSVSVKLESVNDELPELATVDDTGNSVGSGSSASPAEFRPEVVL